ncbi:hypothetical protein Nepgr_003445 [Nepenthes gracilis]|uniref:BHLH domain-containing protein n=1 Tax=Nepenthes gracilis TaxID=150966 RepID=A0AAD3XDX2_NEPGR|nr:hypothetical protein Nepgr_003445 [Nepenthes gracilis]
MDGHFNSALGWLRPLVMCSRTWDYCVLWKLYNEPSTSSSLKWMGCCCCAGKEERGRQLSILCRDTFIPHPARKKACEALAKLPSSLPLCSGIHGEVIDSSEPRWVHHIANISDAKASAELIGTQALIPVIGGLVELFAAKHISKNQEMIDFVMAQFHPSTQLETATLQRCTNMSLQLQSFDSFLWTKRVKRHEVFSSSCDNYVIGGDRMSICQRPDGEKFRSKNLLPERKRRNKIRDGLFALRGLVPKITKMDRASILGDAIDYINELEGKVKQLRNELGDLTETKGNNSNLEQKLSDLDGKIVNAENLATSSQSQGSYGGERQQVEAHVEVNKLGSRDLLLKIVWEHKHGAFARLLENLASLGFEVTDANVTSYNGMVSNTLMVQANANDIQAKEVRDSLIKLAVS